MKSIFKQFLFVTGLFLFSITVLGQSIDVAGRVTNKQTGDPLAGATVSLKNSDLATTTNAQGAFSIKVPGAGSVLVVSYVGMTTAEQIVTGSVAEIALEPGTGQTLTDVVVVGYGTQKVTKVSGAISTVKQADITKLAPVRAEEALQGRAAGVNVLQGGSPGSKPTVLIRGIPSFSGTDPVVVIDGIPQTLTDLNSLNPSDIESISVLKDAATTAIYGVKGGNGVIVVTTISGRKNLKTQVGVQANYGIQQVANYIGVLNGSEYAAMVNEGSTLAGGPVIFDNLSAIGVGSNWQKEIFKLAPIQSYNVSARGGGERMTYYLGGGYLDQGGIVGGWDKSRFSRGTFTSNLSFDLSSRLKFIFNNTATLLSGRGIQENSFNSVIGSALNFDPTVALLNTNADLVGKYGYSNLLLSEIFNPLTKLDNTYNRNNGTKFAGKFEFQLTPVNNLILTSRFGYTKYDGNAKTFNPLVFYGPLNVENTMNGDGSTVLDKHNSVSHEKASNLNYVWETFGNYNFELNNVHNFETVLGFSLAKTSGNTAGSSRQDVPFNSWEFADHTAATGINVPTNTNALSGYYYQYFRRNLSYFGRLNYDYNEKYLLSATLRRDGSYAFGVDNKFGNFFSGSAGWVVSREDFFTPGTVNFLKLRVSYGTIGNENVNPQYVQIVTGGPSYGSTANSNGYNFNNVFYSGSTVASAMNDALRWEKQNQLNAGFDIGLLSNKFNLSADYFDKRVDGLLFTPSASMYLGTIQIPTANIGSTKSSGVDATLTYNDNLANDFHINTSLTFTKSKNLVTATNEDGSAKIFGGSYFNGQSQTVTVFEKDQAPGYFYGWKTLGLFQNQDQINKAPEQAGAQPGDIIFADINEDGIINALDKTNIGNPFPDFTMGWNLNLTFKALDFNMFTYASYGNEIYRAYERNANYSNKDRMVLGRWTGEGTTNNPKTPRYSFTDANSNIRVSERYVEDGSFIKIKNIQLGYTLPVYKNLFKSFRIFAQVKNAVTLTKYTGFDPEIPGGILDSGVDRGAYPQARIFAGGLEIKF